MPIKFELTFNQPLLLQLDAGRVGGPKSYAKAITNAYVRTMLTGIPGRGSIPPALPAPALGTPPPPFPLPALPINNYKSRQAVMERILRTYFEIREFLPVRSNITETYRAVRALIQKGKRFRSDLRTLNSDLKRVTREMAELPKTLEQIKDAMVLLIQNERDRVELLYKGLFEFRATIPPDVFERVFQRELLLYNTIRSFKVTLNPADFDQIMTILNGLEDELNAIPDIAYESEDAAVKDIKVYIKQQIKTVLQRVVAIGNSLVSPQDYIEFYRDLVEEDERLRPVLVVVERYRAAVQFLEPQIQRLERKKIALINKIRSQITEKLKELKAHLKQKINDAAKKRDSKGKRVQFVRAARTVKDTKKKYLRKIRDAKSVLSDTRFVITTSVSLINKTLAFPNTIKVLYEQEIKQYIDAIKSDSFNRTDIANIQTTEQITLSAGSVSPTVREVGREAESLEAELTAYLGSSSIKDPIIRSIISKPLLTANIPTITPFIDFFESKSDRLLAPFLEVATIARDFREIEKRIKNIIETLRNKRRKSASRFEDDPGFSTFVGPREPKISFYELVLSYIDIGAKFIESIQKKINKLVSEVKYRIADFKQKLLQDVQNLIITLLPIKSDVQDKKNKVAIIKNKKEKIKNGKNLLIRRIRQTTYAVRAIRSFTSLGQNLVRKKIRYTENSSAINGFIDSIYQIKILDSPNAANTQMLRDQQRVYKETISDYYYGLELLWDLYTEIKITFEDKKVLLELKNYIESYTTSTVDAIVINDYRILYEQLEKLFTLSNPKDLFSYILSTNFNFGIFEKTHIKTVLFNLESAFFNDIRTKYNRIAENSFVKRVFVKNKGYPTGRYETEPTPSGTRRVPLIKPFEESIIAGALRGLFNTIEKLIDFIEKKIYDRYLKPLIDKIKDKINRIRQNINEELKIWVQRQLNIDAKLMTIAFALATKAFWTGFSWTTPNGIIYTCTGIGPFLPLKARPDEGISGLVRNISKNMNLQLQLMRLIVTPPSATGIPPFPAIGYQ